MLLALFGVYNLSPIELIRNTFKARSNQVYLHSNQIERQMRKLNENSRKKINFDIISNRRKTNLKSSSTHFEFTRHFFNMLKLSSNSFFFVQTSVKIFRDAISQVEIACSLQTAQRRPNDKEARMENQAVKKKNGNTHVHTCNNWGKFCRNENWRSSCMRCEHTVCNIVYGFIAQFYSFWIFFKNFPWCYLCDYFIWPLKSLANEQEIEEWNETKKKKWTNESKKWIKWIKIWRGIVWFQLNGVLFFILLIAYELASTIDVWTNWRQWIRRVWALKCAQFEKKKIVHSFWLSWAFRLHKLERFTLVRPKLTLATFIVCMLEKCAHSIGFLANVNKPLQCTFQLIHGIKFYTRIVNIVNGILWPPQQLQKG